MGYYSRERQAKCYYPEMENTNSLSRFPFRDINTLSQDRRKRREITNNQFVQPHQTGTSFHTTWSVDGKGDRLWLTFDPSRPCSMFCTTETRFLKPKLHTVLPDPYERRP